MSTLPQRKVSTRIGRFLLFAKQFWKRRLPDQFRVWMPRNPIPLQVISQRPHWIMKRTNRALLQFVLGLYISIQSSSGFYDPRIGRWLSRDPIEEEGGQNTLAFVANDPVRLFDIDGKFFFGCSRPSCTLTWTCNNLPKGPVPWSNLPLTGKVYYRCLYSCTVTAKTGTGCAAFAIGMSGSPPGSEEKRYIPVAGVPAPCVATKTVYENKYQ
jgi:hypothetical protein